MKRPRSSLIQKIQFWPYALTPWALRVWQPPMQWSRVNKKYTKILEFIFCFASRSYLGGLPLLIAVKPSLWPISSSLVLWASPNLSARLSTFSGTADRWSPISDQQLRIVKLSSGGSLLLSKSPQVLLLLSTLPYVCIPFKDTIKPLIVTVVIWKPGIFYPRQQYGCNFSKEVLCVHITPDVRKAASGRRRWRLFQRLSVLLECLLHVLLFALYQPLGPTVIHRSLLLSRFRSRNR